MILQHIFNLKFIYQIIDINEFWIKNQKVNIYYLFSACFKFELQYCYLKVIFSNPQKSFALESNYN